MQISEYAIVINASPHGENNAIVTVFTQNNGILNGFAKRVKSKNKPNIFVAGNVIKINFMQREGTMGLISGESYKMYIYSCMNNQLQMKLILALCSCLKIALGGTEKNGSGDLFSSIMFYLEGVKHELPFEENLFNFVVLVKKILDFCGYSFRLNKCIVTGNENIEDLIFLSPKSAASVCKSAGQEYSHLMFKLPKAFITDDYLDIKTQEDLVGCIKIIDFFINKNFNKQMPEIPFFLLQFNKQ